MTAPVVCVIQARVGSTRFPAKVLSLVNGRPVIQWLIKRVKKSFKISRIILATSNKPGNESLSAIAASEKIGYFAGSEDDVLDRFYQALKSSDVEKKSIVVRITGDCPLMSAEIIDSVIAKFIESKVDYASNIQPPTFPDGLDVEVFSFESLERAWKEASDKSDREHVTPYLRSHPDFKRVNVESERDYSSERWTLDYPDDLKVIESVFEHFQGKETHFSMEDVLRFRQSKPEVFQVNQSHIRNEGLATSQKADFAEKYAQSIHYLEKAKRLTPLGSQTFSKSSRYFTENAAPAFIERGCGGRVWDIDGNEFSDFILSLGAITVGYCNEEITSAIEAQLRKGTLFSQASLLEVQVAEKLTQIIPCAEMVRFVKNGSDATSAAVRLARAFTRRDIVLCCGYHGWQDWAIAATPHRKGVPEILASYTKTFLYNDLESLRSQLAANSGKVAAVIMEPIQGDGPNEGYLNAVKDMVHHHGALLIYDEVVSGFRYALAGGQEYYGVVPDLAAFGKGVGNGMPLSVVAGRADVLRKIEEGVFISSTFGGELLSLAAVLKTIEILERPGTYEKIWKLSTMWKDSIVRLVAKYDLQKSARVFGLAPHAGIEFNNTGKLDYLDLLSLYQQELIRYGVLSLGVNNFCVMHDEADVQKFISAADQALEKIKEAIARNSVDGLLLGGKINPIFKRN